MDHAVLIGAIALAVTLLGASIRTAKSHIETRVQLTCDEKLDKIEQDVTAIRLNIGEVSHAVGKVADLEQRIGNGLERRLIGVEAMTSEMHGWMRAQNGSS